MKKIKKKIYSIISSLLVSSTLISKVPKVKAMYVDDEKDEEMEDELNFSKEDEFDELDDGYEQSVDWLGYLKNHPWELAGGLCGLWGLYSVSMAALGGPDEKERQKLTPENLIREHLPSEYKNSPNLEELPGDIKMRVLVEICKNLSNKYMPKCKRKCGLDGWEWSTPRAAAVQLMDRLYCSLRKRKKAGLDLLARRASRAAITNCYHIASAIKYCADLLHVPCLLVLNYVRHVYPIVRCPVDSFSFLKKRVESWIVEAKENWVSLESFVNDTDDLDEPWGVYKVANLSSTLLYESDVIFNGTKAFVIVNEKNKNKTAVEALEIKTPERLKSSSTSSIPGMLEAVYNDSNIQSFPRIKEIPKDERPKAAGYPVSYLNMIRKL